MTTSTVWVLGNGQLGNMLRHAGEPLGITVKPVDLETTETLPIGENALITAEREHWPTTQVTQQLTAHENFISLSQINLLADRLTQKQAYDKLGLATAPWKNVCDDVKGDALLEALGDRVLLKWRSGGYDGKGQHWLKKGEDLTIPADWQGQAIAEQAINFDEEVSIVGARNQAGECIFYPLTLNLHENGILMASVAMLPRLSHLQAKAEGMLKQLMDELNYEGTMAMECFRVGDELLINEVAPRVHNSGHWTQSGASMNQFEAHLRAITHLPLVQPLIHHRSLMINLIGVEHNSDWLSVPGVELYWYNKEVRPGRKLGHLNLCFDETDIAHQALDQLAKLLPERYATSLGWVNAQLDS